MQLSVPQVWELLDSVPDPEIPVISVVDLGIVRSVKWVGDTLEVAVTPTYSGCPATYLDRQAGRQILESHKNDAKGRAKLEDYGIAPPRVTGVPARCPRCKSDNLDKISQFGSTPCKAQWRCLSCLEPFDYFKCI